MSQLRLNPLTGRWVTLVADRAKRPTDFAPRLAQVEADPSKPCPFCPGNEESTPPALEQVDSEGKWTLRVVPNLYPAFEGDGNLTVRNLGPVHTMADASGIHEVFVITPDHTAGVGTFTDKVIRDVMTALRRRFEEHARTPNVRYTQAFINHSRIRTDRSSASPSFRVKFWKRSAHSNVSRVAASSAQQSTPNESTTSVSFSNPNTSSRSLPTGAAARTSCSSSRSHTTHISPTPPTTS
jgi:hypothetical protein